MNQFAQQSDHFRKLLGEISEEFASLRSEIRELKKENAGLRMKLENLRDEQTDIFSAISESERLALREQIKGMIRKIDNHIGTEHEVDQG